ncbi:MAG TPA: hypothetical protein VKC11_00345 [Steroidobacteraceae bacterium]|nr:hypothetical protein [Steroidobacteraceae bacterium]
MEKRSAQCVDGGLQVLDREDHGLDGGAFGVKGGVRTGDVILNELHQIAVKILIGDLLPGSEIESRLVESTPEALGVLRDKARHEAAGDDSREQQQAVEQAAYKKH